MKKLLLNIAFVFLLTPLSFSQQVTYDWQHIIPGNTYTALCCMATDSAGNIYVGGRLDSTVTFVDTTVTNTATTGFLAKFTSDGDMLWYKQFEYSSTVYSICFDSENMMYISGSHRGKVRIGDTLLYTHDSDTTFYGMFLARLDTAGNRIWAKTTAGCYNYESGYGKLKQMTIDRDDNIVLVGTCIDEIEFFDTTITYTKTLDSVWYDTPFPHWEHFYALTNYLAKFDKDGHKLWIKDVGMYYQHYYAIATDYSNNILLTGCFYNDTTFVLDTVHLNASSGENLFIAKYNPNGLIIWAQRGGGASYSGNQGYDIVADESNNVYITGVIDGGAVEFGGSIYFPNGTYFKSFITSFDSTGIVNWVKRFYSGITTGYGYGFCLTIKENDLFFCGTFRDSLNFGYTVLNCLDYPYSFCGIFLRLDTIGNVIDAAMDTLMNQYFLDYLPIFLSPDNNNSIYVAGNYTGTPQSVTFGKFSYLFLDSEDVIPVPESNFFILPNPCNGYFFLLSEERIPFLLEIFNISGILVYSVNINESYSFIDVSSIPSGFYLVKVNNRVKKMLIN